MEYAYDKLGRLNKRVTNMKDRWLAPSSVGSGSGDSGYTTNREIGETYSYIGTPPNSELCATDRTTQMVYQVQYHGHEFAKSAVYSYDKRGNIIKIVNGSNITTYQYDELNRLIRENNQEMGKTLLFTYDDMGNILTIKKYAYTTYSTPTGSVETLDYNYNSQNQLINVRHEKSNGIVNYEISDYDSIGNACKYRGFLVEWNRGRNLSKYGNHTYRYNASGVRLEKITAGGVVHKYWVEGDRIHRESRNNAEVLWYSYDATGLEGFTYNGLRYHYQRNIQGDIIRIFNDYGELEAQYIYDAWGNHKVLDANGVENTSLSFIGNINPFRYRGYYYDAETGLYYFQTRYYDSTIGRFIQPADVSSLNPQSINGLNLYTYAVNNPISFAYNSSVSNVGTAIGSVNSAMNSGISNNKLGNLYSNSINIMGGLHALSSAFAFVDQWSGFLSGGIDGGLGYWGPEGFGIQSLGKYSSMVSKFGKGMIIAGSILSWGSSVYNNFNNPNYTMGEAFGASAMDAGYYTAKGVGTYYAGIGVGKAAVGLGIAAGGAAITYLGVGFAGALAIGGGVAVVVGIAGAVAIYYLGELLDYGWSELKKALFE